jgi:hypothetical protein
MNPNDASSNEMNLQKPNAPDDLTAEDEALLEEMMRDGGRLHSPGPEPALWCALVIVVVLAVVSYFFNW